MNRGLYRLRAIAARELGMGRTGEVDFNRLVACVVVVAAHFAFFWGMTRKITLPLPAGDTGDALQLTWIEPPASPRSTPPTPATTHIRRDRAPASTRDPPADRKSTRLNSSH